MRSSVRYTLPLLIAVGLGACGDPTDDSGGSATATEGTTGTAQTGSTSTSTSSTDTTTGATTSSTATSTGTTGSAVVPCWEHLDQQACEAADPGNGQLCGWTPVYGAATRGDLPDLTCEYFDVGFLCVQLLGDTGGTPFGSCGGDGTPPVYWAEVNGSFVFVSTDGFFTPDGYSPCDCHDGTPTPPDPVECCCACQPDSPPPGA